MTQMKKPALKTAVLFLNSLCIFLLSLILFTASAVRASALDELLKETEGLEEYLKQITTTITSLSMKQEYIQAEIDETQLRMEENEVLLEEAEQACAQQAESMKLRIKYLYESGQTNYLEALLSSDSISDILNRFEYIDNIVGYDREMLEKYAEVVDRVESLQTSLGEKKEELEALKVKAQENFEQAVAVSNSSVADIAVYGVDAQDASGVISDYISEYGDEIRQSIEADVQQQMEEDQEYNWYEEPWTEPDTWYQEEPATDYSEPTEPYYEEPSQEPVSEDPSDEPEPTSEEPSSEGPSEEPEPTSEEPSSEEPYEEPEPTTEEPVTEPEPTTEEPVTEPEPTTEEPRTEPEPTTEEPWTEPEPTTEEPYNQGGYESDWGLSDVYMIACMCSAEVGYQGYEAQWHCADVIINNSAVFGSVYNVIHYPGAFECYDNGTYMYYIQNGPFDSCLAAANDAYVNRGASRGYTGFCAGWFYESYPGYFTNTVGEMIGGEYFYKYQ